ncbi:MAG: RsmD family RNA methyltransferase [Fibrobacterota bacterium]
MTLKLSGGLFKGRPIATDPGHDFRPTTDRHRQMIFNILGKSVQGIRFLDAYAGSGAMGLEAVSRGVSYAVFIENFPPAVQRLTESIQSFGIERLCRVITGDAAVPETLGLNAASFDVIYLDPPYENYPIPGLAGYAELLESGGLFIAEHSSRNVFEAVPGLEFDERRKSGDSAFSFFRKP